MSCLNMEPFVCESESQLAGFTSLWHCCARLDQVVSDSEFLFDWMKCFLSNIVFLLRLYVLLIRNVNFKARKWSLEKCFLEKKITHHCKTTDSSVYDLQIFFLDIFYV